jgi:hypothetical protein
MPVLLQVVDIGWDKYLVDNGAVIVLIVIVFAFLLRVLPTWKEIKIKEIDVRSKESETTGQLANALNQLGNTMSGIAVEQRKATDNILILQRVNASETGTISDTVDRLCERMDSFEEAIKENGKYVSNRPKAVTTKRD